MSVTRLNRWVNAAKYRAAYFRSPMAIAVIWGLLSSTVLSQLVIPVVFTYVDNLLLLLKRVAGTLHRANHGVGTAGS